LPSKQWLQNAGYMICKTQPFVSKKECDFPARRITFIALGFISVMKGLLGCPFFQPLCDADKDEC
jgi:hypothetical protein